tara:strand:- start:77 stop:1987 length:1911 start_codon:yes stop_codon:yes gene_type:complete
MGKERESANIVSTLTGIAVTISGDPVVLGVGNTEHFRITGSGLVGIGTDNPGSLVHAVGSYGTVRIENDNTAQYAASGIELKGPAGDERSTKIVHGNNDTGGTETYFQIEQLNSSGSYVKTLSTYSYQYDYWAFNTGGSERIRITSDGKIGVNQNSPGCQSGGIHAVHDATEGTPSFTGGEVGIFQRNFNSSQSCDISIISGTASKSTINFGDKDDVNVGMIQYENNNNALVFTTNASERLRITGIGSVGIGTDDPNRNLHVHDGDIRVTNAEKTNLVEMTTDGNIEIKRSGGGSYIDFADSTSDDYDARIQENNNGIKFSTGGAGSTSEKFNIASDGVITGRGELRLTQGTSSVADGAEMGSLMYLYPTNNNKNAKIAALVNGGTSGADLVFYTREQGDATNSDGGAERLRIASNGHIFQGTTINFPGAGNSNTGFMIENSSGGTSLFVSRGNNIPCYINRNGDGVLISLRSSGSETGNLTQSGTAVSLTGAHLSRYSQLAGNAERIEILRGTVLSNLDEMCEWGEEDNEQLNRMKISDVEGDINVAGVFQSWDNDDSVYINDFYCAMTGDFVIRIAQGTTVARGDLLVSAGDGTAKPQDDDIIRSKTVAKVTSTTVSATYADGSYCVPCVLMAC